MLKLMAQVEADEAADPLPLSGYIDADTDTADLSKFDPARRCVAAANGEATVFVGGVRAGAPLVRYGALVQQVRFGWASQPVDGSMQQSAVRLFLFLLLNSDSCLRSSKQQTVSPFFQSPQAAEVGLTPAAIARHLINAATAAAGAERPLLPVPPPPVNPLQVRFGCALPALLLSHAHALPLKLSAPHSPMYITTHHPPSPNPTPTPTPQSFVWSSRTGANRPLADLKAELTEFQQTGLTPMDLHDPTPWTNVDPGLNDLPVPLVGALCCALVCCTVCAVLCVLHCALCAVLCRAVLCCAVLCCAVLCCVRCVVCAALCALCCVRCAVCAVLCAVLARETQGRASLLLLQRRESQGKRKPTNQPTTPHYPPKPPHTQQDLDKPFEQLVAATQSAVCPSPASYNTALSGQLPREWTPEVCGLVEGARSLLCNNVYVSTYSSRLTLPHQAALCTPALSPPPLNTLTHRPAPTPTNPRPNQQPPNPLVPPPRQFDARTQEEIEAERVAALGLTEEQQGARRELLTNYFDQNMSAPRDLFERVYGPSILPGGGGWGVSRCHARLESGWGVGEGD